MLRFFGKDLHNAHFVCPADLPAAHDLYMAKKRRHMQMERRQEERRKALEQEASFVEAKGRFFGVVSSSQPGNLPANLQGLWNYRLIPPWDSDYHNNINIQMCYWGVLPSNLAECYDPLVRCV